MALSTIPTTISPAMVSQYFEKLDELGLCYGFNVTSPTMEGRGKYAAIQLTMHRDANDDPLVLVLNQDGTWFAQHEIVVGEQE